MFVLEPQNKWLVIAPLAEDEKVGTAGIIIAPGNARERQHRLARIVAKDDCEEAKNMVVGDLVFYDRIGEVEGRVGNQGFSVVSAKNVLIVIKDKIETDPLAQAIVETHR